DHQCRPEGARLRYRGRPPPAAGGGRHRPALPRHLLCRPAGRLPGTARLHPRDPPGSRLSRLSARRRVLRDDRYHGVRRGRRGVRPSDGSRDWSGHRPGKQLLPEPGARPPPDPLLLPQKDGHAAAGGRPVGEAAAAGLAPVYLACPNRCITNRFELWNASVFVDERGRYLEYQAEDMALYRCTECGSPAVDLGDVPDAMQAERESAERLRDYT